MYNITNITEDLYYIGASDRRLALFENTYPLENGVSYNSYLLADEKTVLLDTTDSSVGRQFLENLKKALNGRPLDYIIINHMEPDHCASLGDVLTLYPKAQLIGSQQVAKMIKQFHGVDVGDRFRAVKEGDELSTGKHTLSFVMAPMVHWPEAMMTYDKESDILFSADAFGRFGALSGNIFDDTTDVWRTDLAESRRYYTNIVGKYGANVQAVLKKAASLSINMICPLHGPVLRSNIAYVLDKYQHWSSYTPEEDATIILYGSIYGGTENAADILAMLLAENGEKNIRVYDISKTHPSVLVGEAFRVSRIVLAAPTVDAGLFAPMETLLHELKNKNLQNRTFALIENGTWAPLAAKSMTALLEGFKNCKILDTKLSIRSRLTEEDLSALKNMAEALRS